MSKSFLPVDLAQNPIVVNVDAADPLQYPTRAGLRYYLELMIPEFYGANTFVKLLEFEQSEIPPDTVAGGTVYGGANFELQDQLDSLLVRNAPTFGQTGIAICDGLVTPYFVQVRISNNDVDIANQTYPVQYAIKAGIAERDYSAYKASFFPDYIGSNGRFLTWTPDKKRVQADQPEFLYWLANVSPAPAELRLMCEPITNFPGVDQATFMAASLSTVTMMTVYCLAVGPSALGLDKLGVAIIGYKVWLADQAGNKLTEVRTYQIDPTYQRNTRHIVFANSLGGFDTICLTGQGEESLKVTRSISDRYPDYGYEPQYAEQVINGATGERELTVNTGWLTQYGREYLQELLLTKEAYLLTDRALLPLLPKTESIRVGVDDEGLIGRALVFTYTNPERNFSNLPARTNIPVRQTGWRPKATACLLDDHGRRTGKKGVMLLEKYYLDDGSRFKPVIIKANVPGTEGYIRPDFSLDCQLTPFLSAPINRAGSFNRANCADGQVGGPATIAIAAGAWGSELNQADANAKAEAEFNRLNTQAYADQNGTCVVAPEIYDWNVPAGKFHYRSGRPTKMDVEFRNSDQYPVWGNSYFVQNVGGPNVFPYGSNDLDFPVNNEGSWVIRVYGTPGTRKRVRSYRNAVLVNSSDMTMNSDGFEQGYLLTQNAQLQNGDKIYIRIDDL